MVCCLASQPPWVRIIRGHLGAHQIGLGERGKATDKRSFLSLEESRRSFSLRLGFVDLL